MALTTYDELKASIAAWLRRSDLTSAIPDFIALAEAQMNRRLRVRPMVARATASLGDEYSAAPSDFIAPISLTLDADPVIPLEYVSPERIVQLEAMEWEGRQGRPAFWSIVGTEFRFYPAPEAAYTGELTYWQKIPALSDSNTSNWVLENHPDAYLYGALLQSAPYLRSDDRISAWSPLYLQAIADIERAYAVSNTTTLRMDDLSPQRGWNFARGY